MFDTMTLTKAVGSLCGALLIFLMGKWAGELLYDTSPGHGGDDHAAGYVIEVADTGGGGEAGQLSAQAHAPAPRPLLDDALHRLVASAALGRTPEPRSAPASPPPPGQSVPLSE